MFARWKNARKLRPSPWLPLLVVGVAAWLGTCGNTLDAQEKPKEPAAADKLPAAGVAGADKIEIWRQSIALVEGKKCHGSGFVVRPGVVVTNAHVIEDQFLADLCVRFVTTSDPDPKAMKVKLLYENSRRDLAFLQVEPRQPALALAKNPLFPDGKKILVLGNPSQDGGKWARINTVLEGTTVGLARAWDEPFYELKALTGPGTSGGPVLDRTTGEVIGVHAACMTIRKEVGDTVHREPTETSFCIPVQALHEALAVLDSPDAAKAAAACEKRHLETLIIRELCRAHRHSMRTLRARIDLAVKAPANTPADKERVLAMDRDLLTSEKTAYDESHKRITDASNLLFVLSKGNTPLNSSICRLWKNYQATQDLHRKPPQLVHLIDVAKKQQQRHEQLLNQVVEELRLSSRLLKPD